MTRRTIESSLELGSFDEVRNGVHLKFRITTIPPELGEAVVHHLLTYYLPREPTLSHRGVHEDEGSITALTKLFKDLISLGTSIAAIRDGPEDEAERLIGVNMLYVAHKDDPPFEVIQGTKCQTDFDAMSDIASRGKVFEKYGIDAYLSSCGISVHPDYHGYRVGERLLEARKPLALELGVKVTGSVFTHEASNYLAKKIGYILLSEVDVSDYRLNGVHVFEGMTGKAYFRVWDFS